MNALQTILLAGFACGVLDGLSATALAGGHWVRLFQFVASGILGPGAFKGGPATAGAGIAVHFFIATSAAAVYYLASRALPILLSHALVAGALYGATVHVFMNTVVIPLSAVQRPFSMRGFLTQLAVHMIVVGPSISLVVQRYSR